MTVAKEQSNKNREQAMTVANQQSNKNVNQAMTVANQQSNKNRKSSNYSIKATIEYELQIKQ